MEVRKKWALEKEMKLLFLSVNGISFWTGNEEVKDDEYSRHIDSATGKSRQPWCSYILPNCFFGQSNIGC